MAGLDTLITSLKAFGGGRSFEEQGTLQDEANRRRQAQLLQGQIAAAPSAAARNPLLEQLAAIAPTQAATSISNFGQLDEQRQKAMFRDAFRARQLAERDPIAAVEFLDRRLQAGAQLGGEMTDTQEIRDAYASGDPAQIQAANEELDTFISFGAVQGLSDATQDIVQSSKILDDGSTIQTLRSGKTRFIDPSGNVLTGAERAEAIKTASEFGIEEQGERALIRRQKEQSQKIAKDAFDQLGPIRTAIANLDDVERVIEAGAGTGVVQSRLPSIRAASIELDNLRNRMGLDVIGGTTFGALSESELQFALDTALPDRLEGPELLDWVRRKRDAQQKVLGALTEQAKFFSRGGTINDLLLKQEKDKANQVGPETEVITPQGATNTGRFQVEIIQE